MSARPEDETEDDTEQVVEEEVPRISWWRIVKNTTFANGKETSSKYFEKYDNRFKLEMWKEKIVLSVKSDPNGNEIVYVFDRDESLQWVSSGTHYEEKESKIVLNFASIGGIFDVKVYAVEKNGEENLTVRAIYQQKDCFTSGVY